MSNKDYLLAVITVSRNSELFIARCLKSLEQLPILHDGSKYLHIVIDGLSSDATFQIANDWTYRDDFDRILICEPDKGLYDAMNKGLSIVQESSVSWFTYLNSDDQFASLDSSFIHLLNGHHGDAISFASLFDTEKGFRVVEPLRKCFPFSSQFGLPFLHQATLYNSRVAEEAYFDLRLKITADYLFMVTFVDAATVCFTPSVLTIFDCKGLSSSLSATSLNIENSRAVFMSNKSLFAKCIGSIYQISKALLYDAKYLLFSTFLR